MVYTVKQNMELKYTERACESGADTESLINIVESQPMRRIESQAAQPSEVI